MGEEEDKAEEEVETIEMAKRGLEGVRSLIRLAALSLLRKVNVTSFYPSINNHNKDCFSIFWVLIILKKGYHKIYKVHNHEKRFQEGMVGREVRLDSLNFLFGGCIVTHLYYYYYY